VIGVNKMSNIVQQLIDGQAEIDRMRKEICQVVNMILGLATDVDAYYWTTDRHEFVSHGCVWEVSRTEPHNRLWARCFSLGPLSYESSWKPNMIEPSAVKRVHEGLKVFINGMLSVCPNLSERLQDFLDVAKE